MNCELFVIPTKGGMTKTTENLTLQRNEWLRLGTLFSIATHHLMYSHLLYNDFCFSEAVGMASSR